MALAPDGSSDQPAAASAQGRVADELRRAIISGELAPKSQVSEAALAAKHGVSRTPIREALKQLEIEGLVRIVPRVGTFVTQPSWSDIVELSQVKEMLEGLAARLVAQRGDPAVLTALEHALENAEKSLASADLDRFAQIVRDFHDAIMIGSGNRKLLQHYRMLMNQMAYGRVLDDVLRDGRRAAACQEEHRAIVRAITARDPDAAELATRQHVIQAHRALSRTMLGDGAQVVAAGPATHR
jgi:DNA-binding GntR family transcriptional regulator